MVNATVKAGVCGFTTRITATSEDEQHVVLQVVSDCEKIRRLAAAIPPLDSYKEIEAGHDGDLMTTVRGNMKGCCAGCIVPGGIFKAMQVAAGLALPQEAAIKVEKDG